MRIKNKKISARLKIVSATATVIFTLATAFTSTIAWFSTKTSVEVSGGSFTVQATGGIDYELYYLDHFVDNQANKPGNYSSVIDSYCGYQVASGTPVFYLAEYDDDGVFVGVKDNSDNYVVGAGNPTDISNLWPAHKLTYALVIETGTLKGFSLEDWDETTNENVITVVEEVENEQVVEREVEISLSWAINLYGAAYNDINKTNDVYADVANGFAAKQTYINALTDIFGYNQDLRADDPRDPTVFFDSAAPAIDNKRQIIYFSIEFDNDEETYYSIDEDYEDATKTCYVKDEEGNSNCYENLHLMDLVFKLS